MGVITCLVLVGLAALVLRKLKLLGTLAVVFMSVVLLYMAMSLYDPLKIEPVYGLLKGFFESLPDMVGRAVDYVSRMIRGIGLWIMLLFRGVMSWLS